MEPDRNKASVIDELRILEAMLQAINEREKVFAAIETSETHEEALAALGQVLGIGEIRARAVLDMQARRWTHGEARKLEAQIAVRRSEPELL
ncbi:DNA gyrase subunit A [Paeniglutamicibacter antarcticus]|uniref:DNA topoisomerase (ATP-hydrolyzing) n=1 Tax=Paeniglutamicibacter antarcticus TaxID=494023 RepID=A0ABP9TPY7_9MICC